MTQIPHTKKGFTPLEGTNTSSCVSKWRVRSNPLTGFTLIEALVAISVLLLSIVGPMAIATDGIKNSIFAKDQITAFYIGQEGIELIRSIRDGNALSGDAWDTGISAFCMTSGNPAGCGIDAESLTFVNCTTNANCNLYFNPNGLNVGDSQRGIFEHGVTPEATIFNRSIRITDVPPDEKEIDVVVTWLSRGAVKTITVQSRLFDQYNALAP